MTTGRWMAGLASLKLTLALIVGTGGLLLYGILAEQAVGRALAVPFGLLFVNLVAAVAVHGKLRRQTGLLVFHLGLAALALIAAIGRLMAFDGQVELADGSMLELEQVQAYAETPLHPLALDRITFAQRGFTIDYGPGMQRGQTRSTVSVPDGDGGWSDRVFGDDHPLILDGYRFYTTPNKGFAPVLTWTPQQGETVTGAIHLPGYPLNEDRQGNEWTMPDGRLVTLWLEIERPIYDENGPWQFRLPEDSRLVVIDGDRRQALRPGDSMAFPGGSVRYERLVTWMGYRIFFDPMLPWLLAASAIAVAGLALHALGRLRQLTEGPAWREVADVG